MSHLSLYQVDAFTARAFGGNPAGVCLLDAPHPDEWMRSVAMEMNLSETAFLLPESDGYRLRWFTPLVEVDLCGHATLASAHILFERGLLSPQATARFFTRSGLLTARLQGEWIELNFPVEAQSPVEAPAGLAEALGVQPHFVGKNRFDYLVEVASEEEVRSLRPDIQALSVIPARGVIVTARGAGEYHFVSRFFAPQVGIAEDPVTGSAHSCLTPYWAEKLGRTEMLAYQASARGGVLRVRLEGERVALSGQAVTVIEGTLLA